MVETKDTETPLPPEEAAERVAKGKTLWVDLEQAAKFCGVPPETFTPALESDELVAFRKSGTEGNEHDWADFVISTDALFAWMKKRKIEPLRKTVN